MECATRNKEIGRKERRTRIDVELGNNEEGKWKKETVDVGNQLEKMKCGKMETRKEGKGGNLGKNRQQHSASLFCIKPLLHMQC